MSILLFCSYLLKIHQIVLFIIKWCIMKVKRATQVTGCKQCNKGFSNTQKGLVVLGTYIFLSSIYGTIEIIKFIMSLF